MDPALSGYGEQGLGIRTPPGAVGGLCALPRPKSQNTRSAAPVGGCTTYPGRARPWR